MALAPAGYERAPLRAIVVGFVDTPEGHEALTAADVHVDDPAEALLRVSGHADLLVCGSRGHGPLRSVLLGGVSRRLVDEARCPVLVLPRKSAAGSVVAREGQRA